MPFLEARNETGKGERCVNADTQIMAIISQCRVGRFCRVNTRNNADVEASADQFARPA